MKAVHFFEHGNLTQLQYGDVESPVCSPDSVLVNIKAAALNRLDLWVLAGWKGLELETPHIPGADGAGILAELGTQVHGLVKGSRVVINPNISCGSCPACLAGRDNLCRNWHLLGETIPGTMAEYVVVPAYNVLPIPESISCTEAAASSLVYLTAWHSLITRGNLNAGETVLIIGASGGVNTASIQIAKLAGAQVLVVGSDANKLALAEKLGADQLFDRSKLDNWSKSVFQATGKQGVDIVVDNVGAETMPLSLRLARKGGRILTVGNSSGPELNIDNRFIFGKHLTIAGSSMGTRADFQKVMNLIFAGRLRPVLDMEFPMAQAQNAFERLQSGQQQGKVTLAF